MVRIRVDPDQLRSVGAALQRVLGDLQALENRIGSVWSGLEWEARQRVGIESQVNAARSRANALATQAESLAHYLTAKAQAFEEADRQGAAEIDAVFKPVLPQPGPAPIPIPLPAPSPLPWPFIALPIITLPFLPKLPGIKWPPQIRLQLPRFPLPDWFPVPKQPSHPGPEPKEAIHPIFKPPHPVTVNQPKSPTSGESDPRFRIDSSPLPMDRVTSINWYGNTEWAFQNRGAYYSQLQGIHSGIDFIVPAGTPITSAINRRGKVISIDNQPYDYKAGPHNILVDYGDFLVLYGHMSPNTPHQVGDPIDPGSIIGNSGTDGTTPHLHMEVIRKHPEWDSLPPEKQTVSRPGNIRTNPVPYLSPEVQKELEQKQWDAFHPTPDGKWQNPSDQPDIDPGKPYLVPETQQQT